MEKLNHDSIDATPPVHIVAEYEVVLAALTRVMTTTPDVSRVCQMVAQRLRKILFYDWFAILLRGTTPDLPGGEELVAAFGQPRSLEIGRLWLLTDFSFGPILFANQPVAMQDFAETAAGHPGDLAFLTMGVQ